MHAHARELPPALVALISHVELAKSEWWQQALQGSLLVALWSANAPTSLDELRLSLKNDFDLAIQQNELQEQLGVLTTRGAVVEPQNGLYKISEEEAEALLRRIEENERNEGGARAHFSALLAHFVPGEDRDRIWNLFNELFVVPLVRDSGARTYGFLEGKPFDVKATPYLDEFLTASNYDGDSLRQAIVGFLDPTVLAVRSFISNRLTAYFFVQASTRDRSLLDQLSKLATSPVRFHVFVDTNLLFSLLQMHENPADIIAEAIADLQASLPGLVDLQLYVTPETLSEARHALQNASAKMRGVVLTRPIVEGTSSVRFSGLQQTFLNQAGHANGIRDAEEYFRGLEENLLTLARERGLELYNQDLVPYHIEQRVIDDIVATTEVQNKARARRNLPEKTYEQIRHDVVLWHFVKDKRDAWVEAPLLAKYWIVTLEYLFLGFDGMKCRGLRLPVPICLHPTVLIQMLQFWLPRDANVESALVRSLRLPVLFQEFDSSLEQVVIKILRTIGRFEDRDAISAETIHALVVNEELRRCLRERADPDEEFELIRAEIVREAEALRESLRKEQNRAISRLEEIGELRSRIAELEKLAAAPAATQTEAAQDAVEHHRVNPRLSRPHELILACGLGAVAAIPTVMLCALYWKAGPRDLRPLAAGTAVLIWLALTGLLRSSR